MTVARDSFLPGYYCRRACTRPGPGRRGVGRGRRAWCLQVWFKNRRAKWRKQKREEQERLRRLRDDCGQADGGGGGGDPTHALHEEDARDPDLSSDDEAPSEAVRSLDSKLSAPPQEPPADPACGSAGLAFFPQGKGVPSEAEATRSEALPTSFGAARDCRFDAPSATKHGRVSLLEESPKLPATAFLVAAEDLHSPKRRRISSETTEVELT
ncbi:diencephalon/mesencephalon homeobox protein 1-like [Penaeus vannamei]|uniref:diencephalon/mesencephalon homeobox protein 1-like n=1 Tax=Penaeus vannamei TaxID=6689 RepID=UPI00387F4655